MKAVVFTEHPGMGRAFVTQFRDEDAADHFAVQNDVLVMGVDDLVYEVERLRRWSVSAADEYNTAKRRHRHAQEMLDALMAVIESDEEEVTA